ncbi:MAG TPA: zf-HC2 domain-containing protein, partial [bacterium]|nr:zf-HC2 domain-containing protein [bacterium]
MKDCKKIHPLLSFYIEEELTPAEKGRVNQHLKVCSDARTELEAYRHLYKASGALPEPQPPQDLHEKIMARVTGKILPIPSRRPLWVFPAWGLATAACLSLFLLIQNPDLLTFNREKTKVSPEEPQKVPPTPMVPNPFSPVPATGGSSGQKEALQAPKSDVILDKIQEPVDNKVAANHFTPSQEASAVPAAQERVRKVKKLSDESLAAFSTMKKSEDLSFAAPANPQGQSTASAPQAQESSANQDHKLSLEMGGPSA